MMQGSRNAAAELWEKIPTMQWAEWQIDWMRSGAADTGPVVQAFAMHRETERAAILRILNSSKAQTLGVLWVRQQIEAGKHREGE